MMDRTQSMLPGALLSSSREMEPNERRSQIDRRQTRRCTPKSDVFMVFRPAFDRLGQITDVSLAGAAFEYPAFVDYEEVAEVEVDLFTLEPAPLLLKSVPCRVVYDILIKKPTVSGIATRRCGLRFVRLSPEHSKQLELLLAGPGSPAHSGP